MRYLIYDIDVAGHHMEYLNHFYVGASLRPNDNFDFYLSEDFLERKHLFDWPEHENIKFHYCSSKDSKRLLHGKAWVNGILNTLRLREVIYRYRPDIVLVTSMTLFLPFATFLLPKFCKLRGILYSIYLYNQDVWPKWRIFAEKLRFNLSVKSSRIEYIYILNDINSCKQLNKIYKCNVFRFLPDPIPNIDKSNVKDLRLSLGIAENSRVFLHFGGMTYRKGTMQILKAIIDGSKGDISSNTFVFAGKVYDDIKVDFYKLIEVAKQKTKVIVFDEFCEYDFLNSLCYTCDFILIPYLVTNLSSGLVGYAAFWGKTIIGPKEGLISNLISVNKLGYTIDATNIEEISRSFSFPSIEVSSDYLKQNSLSAFINTIFE